MLDFVQSRKNQQEKIYHLLKPITGTFIKYARVDQ